MKKFLLLVALFLINQLHPYENKIDLYMTRSWATVSMGKERISKHKHKQSHISFAYYLKKNEKSLYKA